MSLVGRISRWPLVAKVLAAALTVFLVITLFVLSGIWPGQAGNASWLTFAGIALGAVSGSLGILTTRRDGTAITPWGWVAAYGVLVSFVVSGTSMVVDQRHAEQAQLDALQRAEQAAVDLRRAVLRQDGIRLRFQFELDELFPTGFPQTLAEQTVRRGIDQNGGYGISSCHPSFPDLGRSELLEFAAQLDQQEVFVALVPIGTARALLEQLEGTPRDGVIGMLEDASFGGNWATVVSRVSLDDQYRDCLSGIEGDWIRAYWNQDEYRLSYQYLLPAIPLWRRGDETVRDPSDVNDLALVVVSSAIRAAANTDPLSDWNLVRALVELPDGRVFCSETSIAGPVEVGGSGFGFFAASLVQSDSWRCD